MIVMIHFPRDLLGIYSNQVVFPTVAQIKRRPERCACGANLCRNHSVPEKINGCDTFSNLEGCFKKKKKKSTGDRLQYEALHYN